MSNIATQIMFKGGGVGIKMVFSWDRDILEKVKSLSGRKYHDTPQGKFWTCPLTLETIKKLIDWGFDCDISLRDRLAEPDKKELQITKVSSLKVSLRDYQGQCVYFIDMLNGRAIIGDDMGLGKTIEAIAWLELHPEARPAVIVVPSSLKYNWAEEIKKCMSEPDVQILSGTLPWFEITSKIVIVNYEILAHRFESFTVDGIKQKVEMKDSGWIDSLIKLQPKVCIIDEIHNIMNSSANQTKAVIKLAKKCPHVIGIGGTLMLNRPIEGYNALRLINPAIVPSTRFEYGMHFCAGKHNGFGWQFNGASNTKELNEIISRVMIRRMKPDVAKELPQKIRSVIPLEINNRKEYEKAKDDFIQWIKDNKGKEAAQRASRAQEFTRIETLKKIAVDGKLSAVINWLDNYLMSGEKIVLFSTHIDVSEKIHEMFKKESVILTGGMGAAYAQETIHKFQNDKNIKIIVGTLDSRGRPLGVGHTLTAASSTAFIELPWSPGVCDQGEDRVLRIGQTAESVNAYYLIAERTIEVKIARMLDEKRTILKAVIDGEDVESNSLLLELLEDFYKE